MVRREVFGRNRHDPSGFGYGYGGRAIQGHTFLVDQDETLDLLRKNN
jgi:hypothetical protein